MNLVANWRAVLRRAWSAPLMAFSVLIGLAAPTIADQGSLCLPTTGVVSGLTFASSVNAALQALATSSFGASAPANACSLAAVKGQLWLDTSATPNTWKLYDGASWLPVGVSDGTSHIWTPPVGGGAGTIASTTTTTLSSIPQSYVTISGTNTISSFGTGAVTGTVKFIAFSGILTLTYNASSMILPTAASITTQAGDKALFVSLGAGNWAAIAYMRSDGSSLNSNSAFSSNIAWTGAITPTALTTTTNDWAPTGLATASVIRASASNSISLTGISAQTSGTLLILQNISTTTTITLADASASSSAANRFSLGADFSIGPQGSAILRYDGTLLRWTIAGSNQLTATQSQATTGTDNATVMTPLRTSQAISAATTSVFVPVNSSYTLVLANAGQRIEFCPSGGGAVNVTIPPDSSVAFAIPTQVDIFETCSGSVTIVAGAGVTIRANSSSIRLLAIYTAVSLIKRAANDWYVIGALAP